jgi:two-component system copper resistance phosphate regulon response regulator CusR
MRILIVEGDKESGSFIQRGLSGEGFAVDVVDTGSDALELAHHVEYDAIILNAFLPDMTSLSLVNLLRQERYPAVIFLLSRQAQEQGKLAALNAGADDFLVKPSVWEMVARLHIHLRHLQRPDAVTLNPTELVRGDLRMNLLSRRTECGGTEIQLTKKESELLEIFMRHPNQVLSAIVIAEHLWNRDFDGNTNVVERHVSHLRAKMGALSSGQRIETVRGWGYRLAA